MSCMCAKKLQDLLSQLKNMKPPGITLPVPLQQLASMPMGGASSLNSAKLVNNMKLAPLPISAAAMAQIQATASATVSVQAGLGIDLKSPTAVAQLNNVIGSANMNKMAFAPLAGLDPMPWLGLSQLSSLISGVNMAFGVDMMSSGGLAALSTALNAAVGNPMPPIPPLAMSYSSLVSASDSMGVNLAAPGGASSMASNLGAVANLQIPKLKLSLMGLLNPLTILSAIANIIANLGISPTSAGFNSAIAKLKVGLPQFANLVIPADLALGDNSSAGLSSLAAMPPNALAGFKPGALAGFKAPNLGPLTALASFANQCNLAGFPVASSSSCGSGCPATF